MPRLKVEDDELDIDELEGAEYEGGDFQPYDGELPPTGKILGGVVKKMWWTFSSNEDRMLKVLWVADETAGEYEGLPIWENIVLTVPVKFRWKPMLDVFGLTIRDVKTKLYAASEDDSNGAPIEKIASWRPDSDEAYCRIVTKREKWRDEWRVKVDKWLPYDTPAEAELPGETDEGDEEDEAPAQAPTRARRRASQPAEEEAPARNGKARGGRQAAATVATAARGRRKPAAKGSTEDPPF